MNLKQIIMAAAVVAAFSGGNAFAESLRLPGLTKAVFTGKAFDDSGNVYSNAISRVHYPEEMYASSLSEKTTVAWAGYMKMEGGVTYEFRGRYDDFATVKIDGNWVVSKGSECGEVSGSFVPDSTGWYSIEFRVGNNSSAGGCTDSSYYGIVWRKAGDLSWNTVNNGYFGCLFETDKTDVPEVGEMPTVRNSAVGVSNVVCTQRYPWNGKVDIDYEVFADDPASDVWVYATGFDKDANVSMGVRAISGDGANAPVKPGKHRMTWDVTADYPGFNSTAFTVKMTALTGGAPYMVVDLSGGVDALSYPVSYLSSVPAGGWTDEYKTTKLVLRLIPPGTFMMGSPSDELGHNWNGSKEYLHSVVLTRPFYIGVFELTQKQWELVMGDTPSGYKGDARPVENVSYNTIRGSVNGAAWPTHNQVDANSFMGRLRSKVNMLFDLPTEAQWEYSCRAGTSTALNSGKNLTGLEVCVNMAEVGRYAGNTDDGKSGYSQHTKVGSYLENAWGLYDMHGNVREWCLDWWGNGSWVSEIDPQGIINGSYRIVRGGSWAGAYANGVAVACRSSCRRGWEGMSNGATPGKSDTSCGFRVVCLPAE